MLATFKCCNWHADCELEPPACTPGTKQCVVIRVV
jgi:hypothetical protein